MGVMDQADLVTDLKASLNDAASTFNAANDADFNRHLDMAAMDLGRVRRRTLAGTITLQADVSEYDAPTDMLMPKMASWGANEKAAAKPWDASYPGRLPRMSMFGDPGASQIILSPAPTQNQISLLGSSYRFFYFAGHVIGDGQNTQTTVREGDRGLLLLRAQAEAMKELSMRGSKKPVQLRDGMNSAPKNGTPAALFEQLMREFEQQAS